MVKSWFKRGDLVYFFAFLLILGMFTEHVARALPSASIITMLGLTLFEENLGARFKAYVKRPEFFLYAVLFATLLLEYFRTEPLNQDYYFERIRPYASLLAVPLVFGLSEAFTEKRVLNLYYFLLLCVGLYSLGVFVNYLIHFDEINQMYLRSKVLPIGINHVRYGLIVASAIVFGVYLRYKGVVLKYEWEKKLQLGLLLFLTVFIHVLSVRIGLLGFYLGVFVFVLHLVFDAKKKKLGFSILAAIVIVPTIAVFSVPTLRNKLANTKDDLLAMSSTYNANFHSMTGRVVSYKVAFEVIKENLAFGVGFGNMQEEVHEAYAQHFSEIRPSKRIFPHNQYLRWCAASGVLGLLFYLVLLYYPLFIKVYRKNFLLTTHFLILTFSMMLEGTLETQLGLNYGLIFIFLPLSYLKKSRS